MQAHIKQVFALKKAQQILEAKTRKLVKSSAED